MANLPAYIMLNGTMTELHDLFDPGEIMIAYGEFGSAGFIAIDVPEPSTIALNLAVNARRFLAMNSPPNAFIGLPANPPYPRAQFSQAIITRPTANLPYEFSNPYMALAV